MRLRWSIAVGLVVASFGVFFQVRSHEFVNYDDLLYLAEVRHGLSVDGLRQVFTRPLVGNWMPVTWLSLLVDHALYGDRPAGYLLTNVALHAAAAVLLFFAFARMSRAVGPSAFVAAVFALHPLHVESVAWMSERKDVLAGCFFAATLLAYARYAERRTASRYALVLALGSLGLLSKATLVTLPCVLLLLDYWPLGRLDAWPRRRLPAAAPLARALLEKLPLIAVAAGVAALTLWVQRERGFVADEEVFAWNARLANALDASVFYLGKSVWPTGLAVFYPHPGDSLPGWRTAADAGLLVLVTAASLWWARGRPWFAVGWAWYLGTLVPMLGFVQVGAQAAADRYAYLPLIGLSLLPAFAAAELAPRRRVACAAAGGVAVAALAVTAFVQVRHWRDTTTLFERAVAVTDDNAVAHSSLGAAYLQAGRLAEAREQLAAAVRLKPGWSRPRIRLADTLARQQLPAQAIPHYREALQRDPGNARARVNLAQCLIDVGSFQEAAAELRRAAAQRGALPAVHRAALYRGLARTAWEDGRPGAAIRQYRRVLQLRPDDAEANQGLGVALARLGDVAAAGPPLARAAAERAGGSPSGLAARAAEAAVAGRWREGIDRYREALRVRPDLPLAADHLAWLLATAPEPGLRDPAEAIRLMEAALAPRIANPLRLDTLAAAYAASGRFDEAVELAAAAARLTREVQLDRQIRERLERYRRGQPYTFVSRSAETTGGGGR